MCGWDDNGPLRFNGSLRWNILCMESTWIMSRISYCKWWEIKRSKWFFPFEIHNHHNHVKKVISKNIWAPNFLISRKRGSWFKQEKINKIRSPMELKLRAPTLRAVWIDESPVFEFFYSVFIILLFILI